MKSTTFLSLSAVALALSCSLAAAKPEFVKLIPNGDNVSGVKALGHTDKTGDNEAQNAFGKAFDKAGLSWTTALCQADTDGDGQTNGQELGDPCCEWSKGQTPRYTTGLSHPSDASSKANSSLWSSISCSPTTPTPSSSPMVYVAGLATALLAGVAVLGLL